MLIILKRTNEQGLEEYYPFETKYEGLNVYKDLANHHTLDRNIKEFFLKVSRGELGQPYQLVTDMDTSKIWVRNRWVTKELLESEPETDVELEVKIEEFQSLFNVTPTWHWDENYDAWLIEELRRLYKSGLQISRFERSRKVLLKRQKSLNNWEHIQKILSIYEDDLSSPVYKGFSFNIKISFLGIWVQLPNPLRRKQ